VDKSSNYCNTPTKSKTWLKFKHWLLCILHITICTYVTQIIDMCNRGNVIFLYLSKKIKSEKWKKNHGKHIWFSQKGGIKTCVIH